MPRHSKSIVSLVINCGILSGTQLKSKQKFSKQRQRLDFSNMKFSEVAVDV